LKQTGSENSKENKTVPSKDAELCISGGNVSLCGEHSSVRGARGGQLQVAGSSWDDHKVEPAGLFGTGPKSRGRGQGVPHIARQAAPADPRSLLRNHVEDPGSAAYPGDRSQSPSHVPHLHGAV